jgi:hypothetical protein
MCFSATASFATAGLTGAIGIISLLRVTKPRDILLAVVPCIFALQQIVEGSLWLTVATPATPIADGLTLVFLLFAEVFWPLYAPVAVLALEPRSGRTRLMLLCLAIGIGVAGYLLSEILGHGHAARLLDGHIVYVTEKKHSAAFGLAYLAATGLPLVLSSQRAVAGLGVIVLIGCATAYVVYWEALVSVWCFFAAAASVVILYHFEAVRRHPLRVTTS